MEFKWLHNRFYDTYLPDYNAIIEIHGLQHYEQTSLKNRQYKTTEEMYKQTIEVDKLKYDTAILNRLNYYIINASDTDNLFEESKKILTFIDFTNISETECIRFANYKNIKQECELWNQGMSTKDIAFKLNESKSTVQGKLRIGNECGMCIYDKHINMSKSRQEINTSTYSKKVICTTTNKVFNSIKEAGEFYNTTKISDCLHGRQKTAGKHPITQEPLKWEYYNGDKTS